jgi:hypothetical protein
VFAATLGVFATGMRSDQLQIDLVQTNIDAPKQTLRLKDVLCSVMAKLHWEARICASSCGMCCVMWDLLVQMI